MTVTRETFNRGHFGDFADPSQLPNVDGSPTQVDNLFAGDVAIIAGVLYVCGKATKGAAEWGTDASTGGGGGVPTVTMLTDADGEPGEGDLAGALVHTLTPSSGEVWFVDDGTQGAWRYGLLPTEPPLGTVITARVAPVPPAPPGQDAVGYVGTYPNPGAFAFGGDVGSGEPWPLESGVPVTLVCIREYDADDATTPLWQVELGESGPQGPQGSIATLTGIYPSNSAGNYLRGAEGEMLGATTLTVSVVMRLLGVPTTDEVVVSNFEHGTTTGGWGVGVNADGFKVWVSRDSDGALQESTPTGISAFASYGGPAFFLHRLVMVTLTVSGTTATLWVNGVQAQTVTLTGGLRPAAADGYLTTSRNRSASSPMPTATAAFCGLSYREAADAAAIYQRLQFTATQVAGGVIQFYEYASAGGSLYRVDSYADAGPGARSPLTEQGYIGTEALIPQW